MSGIIRGDALALPLPDASVDLVVTSLPYYDLRDYKDGEESLDGQIGREESIAQYLSAIWAATDEIYRVLKPTGSFFVQEGDKYGSGRLASAAGVAERSLLGVPWRYTLGLCAPIPYRRVVEGGRDHPRWTLRAHLVHHMTNALPEPATDRVRRTHVDWLHLVKGPDYFAAIDEIREPAEEPERSTGNVEGLGTEAAVVESANQGFGLTGRIPKKYNSLGKLPGSVWSVPSEPLKVPDELATQHFAAFSTLWPYKFILGWTPRGICTECGEGRVPVVEKKLTDVWHDKPVQSTKFGLTEAHQNNRLDPNDRMMSTYGSTKTTITDYRCACPEPSAPTRPAVVLDPFGGTGTVATVARAMGRVGISVDRSWDYSRLAQWSLWRSGRGHRRVAREGYVP